MNEDQNPAPSEQTPQTPQERPKFVFPGSAAAPTTPPTTGSVPAAPLVPPATAPQPLQAPPAQAPPAAPAQAPPAAPAPQTPPPAAPAPQAPPAHPVQATPPAPPAQPVQAVPVPSAPILTPAAVQPVAAPPAAPQVQPAPVPQIQLTGAAPVPPQAAPQAGMIAPGGLPGAPKGPSTVISSNTMLPAQSKGISTAAKATIGAVLALAIIIIGALVITKMGNNEQAERITALLKQAEDRTANNVPTSAEDVSLLLGAASNIAANPQRQTVYQRLLIAKANDGSNIDAQIAAFAATDANQMIPDIRIRFFEVLAGRKSPSALAPLITYAQSTNNERTAVGAIKACEKLATEKNFSALLNIMGFTRHETVRQTAKRTIAAVVKRTDGREQLAIALKNSYETAGNDEVKRDYLELLGSAGGDDSAAIIRSTLADDDKKTQLAAIAALRSWPDDTMFSELIDYATGQEDDLLRSQSFNAAFTFLKLDRERDVDDLEDMWKMLAGEARTPKEKRQVIDGMAKLTDEWAFSVVEFFEEDDDDDVSFRAERAREHMDTRRQRIKGDDEDD